MRGIKLIVRVIFLSDFAKGLTALKEKYISNPLMVPRTSFGIRCLFQSLARYLQAVVQQGLSLVCGAPCSSSLPDLDHFQMG